jgi:hypothetical protein
MEQARLHQLEHEAVSDLWDRTLTHIPSSYGKLVYLAGLRNPDTGRYEHFGFAQFPNNADANRALRRSHESFFQEWVNYSLEQKKADLELYISTIGQVNRAELLEAWLRLTPYKNLVPASIQGPERQKHISDFEAILGLLKNVYGVASPDPTA